MSLVSVIVPIYNVEEFLPKAIESVLNQTMADFELLLVDDGSPDNSGRICDAYAMTDSRIRVLHQKNQGAPTARNNAMEIATGKYMYFLDGDDWMEPDLLEKMTRAAEEHDACLVVCGFTIDTSMPGGGMFRQHIFAPDAFYETARQFHLAASPLFDNNLFYPPWNKLFLSQRLNSLPLRFPLTFWDDFPFVLGYVRDVERVVLLSGEYYHFTRSRADSETAKYVPRMYEKREEEDEWMRELYAYWQLDRPEDMEFLARRYAERLVGCIENLTNPRCTLSRREKRHEVSAMLASPRAQEALRLARPASVMLKLMFLPLKCRSTSWALLQSRLITFVKTKLSGLFAMLKASRGKASLL